MSRPSLRVLVTAVGGDLGQALVKALRIGLINFDIIGCDVDPSGVGGAFVPVVEAVPPARATEGYVSAIDNLCRRYQIDALIPASEAEISVLSRMGPRLACSAAIVCQPWEWIQVFGDKLRCMQALSPHLPLVPFADSADSEAVRRLVEKVGFPLIIKARRSSGSQRVLLVSNSTELARSIAEGAESVVQQFIEDSEGEFSVGVFASGDCTEVLAFRRELRGASCSWFAETSPDAAVAQYAREFARASRLRGSANIQVRKSAGHVYLLEVNPRFSSLVAARTLCGFRDAEWSVQMALGHSPSKPPSSYGRLRFQRFFHEVVDTGSGYAAIAQWAPRQKDLASMDRGGASSPECEKADSVPRR